MKAAAVLTFFALMVAPVAGDGLDLRACVSGNAICVSGLSWGTLRPQISGVLENNTIAPLSKVQLTFSLFDEHDKIVGYAITARSITIPPNARWRFKATVDEPRKPKFSLVQRAVYSNTVKLESSSQGGVDIGFAHLFSRGLAVGLKAYKREYEGKGR